MIQTKILIATPAYGRQVTVDYMLSVRRLENAFRLQAIHSEINLTIGSVLPRSRAALASKVLNDETFTHLLFVDSDMGFQPSAVMKLLRAEKEFCGCLYPSRQLDLRLLHTSSRQHSDFILARNSSLKYVGIDGVQAGTKLPEGLAGDQFHKTTRIGFGLALICRSVLVKMRDTYPELMLKAGADPAYTEMGAKQDILQAFEAVQIPTGLFLGEDLSFCHRWIEGCGGEIWACVDEEISHVGMNPVIGCAASVITRTQMNIHPSMSVIEKR